MPQPDHIGTYKHIDCSRNCERHENELHRVVFESVH